MGFESKLFSGVKERHKEVHDKPFIAQYSRGEVTLDDHYRHLKQLLGIYSVIENEINIQSFNIQVPLELHELIERKELIVEDLAFLRPYVSESVRLAPLANSTLQYIEYLKKLEIVDEKSNDILLAHFLVRILGDLSGGQSFKGYIKKLYEKQGLGSDKGTAFYEFSEDMHKKCRMWLDSLTAGKQKLYEDEDRMKVIITAANHSFTMHMKIFDELQGRPDINYSRFFVASTVAALTVAAAVGVTMVLK
jgi:heme oxygenase